MFRDSPVEEKLKAFFELCDIDRSGAISKSEFIKLLKKNIIEPEEKTSIKLVVDKIFKSVESKLNSEGEITFETLKLACDKNKDISDIIYKNLNALKKIDNDIDNDIKNDIFSFYNDILDENRTCSFIPSREEKFSKIVNIIVENKRNIIVRIYIFI